MKQLIIIFAVAAGIYAPATSTAQCCGQKGTAKKSNSGYVNSASQNGSVSNAPSCSIHDTLNCILARVSRLEKKDVKIIAEIKDIKEMIATTDDKVLLLERMERLEMLLIDRGDSALAADIHQSYERSVRYSDSLYAVTGGRFDRDESLIDSNSKDINDLKVGEKMLGGEMRFMEANYKQKRNAKLKMKVSGTFKGDENKTTTIRTDEGTRETVTVDLRDHGREGSIGFFDREVKMFGWRLSPAGIVLRSVIGIGLGLGGYDCWYMNTHNTHGDVFQAFHQNTIH